MLVEFQGEFFLMNFELLTFPCREMVKLSIHVYMTCFQNESIYIQKTHILCDACIVYCIQIKQNFKCVFFIMHFSAKSRYHFLGHFFGRIE